MQRDEKRNQINTAQTQRSCRQVNMLLLRAHRVIQFSFVQVFVHSSIWRCEKWWKVLEGWRVKREAVRLTLQQGSGEIGSVGCDRVPLCFPTHQHHLINLPLLLQALLILLFSHMCHLVFILHMHHAKYPKKKCVFG